MKESAVKYNGFKLGIVGKIMFCKLFSRTVGFGSEEIKQIAGGQMLNGNQSVVGVSWSPFFFSFIIAINHIKITAVKCNKINVLVSPFNTIFDSKN